MCINIANEQLQHYFNEHVFRWELDECKRENINLESITYTSNYPIVQLFLEVSNDFYDALCIYTFLLQKNMGLLALIDEESKFSRATDQTLATKLHNTHGKGPRDIYMAPRDGGTCFSVVHYAGSVSSIFQLFSAPCYCISFRYDMSSMDIWIKIEILCRHQSCSY